MRQSSLQNAGDHIARFIAACGRRVWTEQQLSKAITEMRTEWGVAKSIPNSQIIEFLVSETPLSLVHLAFTNRPVRQYWWGQPTPYEAAASLDANGYFSHLSAMHLQSLTERAPDTIYLNVEQKNRGTLNGRLSQPAIDAAFRGPCRISNDRAAYDNLTVCRLSGKNTGNFGLVSRKHPVHGTVRITGIPRTLLDIAVRPVYSGDPTSVVTAYRLAAGRFKIAELFRTLDEIKHAYPYQQAIGFCMERSGGYSEADLLIMQSRISHFNFYLDYGMVDPTFSERWRIYYPRDLPASETANCEPST